jgi:hypothetical protein
MSYAVINKHAKNADKVRLPETLHENNSALCLRGHVYLTTPLFQISAPKLFGMILN